MKLSRLIVIVLLLAAATDLRAQGTTFTYQGFLTDQGSPANGSYDLQFTLYDSAGGSNVVGGPVAPEDVGITHGLFTVTPDFGANPFLTGADRWIEIGVRPGASSGAYTNVSPRQKITSAPYAIVAANITGKVGGASLSGAYGNPMTFSNTANVFNGLSVRGYTTAGLPAAGTAGRLARVTDGMHGLWMDQGSQWFSLSGGIVNVTEFGAVGDGSTNDTTAFNNAIAYLNSINGGTLYIPEGVYSIDSLTITSRAKRIIGSSMGSVTLTTGTQLKCRSAITDFITLSGVGSQIRNLYINGNNRAKNVVRITNNATDLVLDEVTIEGSVNGGVNLNMTSITPNTQISEMKFYGVILTGRTGGTGITGLKVNSNQALVLSFYNLKSGDVAYGIDIVQGDIVLYNPLFTANTINDIRLTAGSLAIFGGRSESATDSIDIDGAGRIAIHEYTHGNTPSTYSYRQKSTFTGHGLLTNGRYEKIVNNGTGELAIINIDLAGAATITGTKANSITRIAGNQLSTGIINLDSTAGGFIIPRMTTTQRNALPPVNGMMIYNTTTNVFNFYEAGAWVTKATSKK